MVSCEAREPQGISSPAASALPNTVLQGSRGDPGDLGPRGDAGPPGPKVMYLNATLHLKGYSGVLFILLLKKRQFPLQKLVCFRNRMAQT